MKHKSILLVGVGNFGKHIARKFNELGHDVMAIDQNEERINAVMPLVTNAQMFKRRIADDTVKHASAICLLYIVLFLLGGAVISAVEGLPLMTCLYETASAIGTVGLTLGVTPSLGTVSRIILIALMFFGRVGGLTLIYATFGGTKKNISKLPIDNVTVG